MDYLDEHKCHMPGDMDIDAKTNKYSNTTIISLGADDLVKWRNLSNSEQGSIELLENHGFKKIALHPQGNKFLLAGSSKKVYEYTISDQNNAKLVYEGPGPIVDVKYSTLGKFISINIPDQKLIIINTQKQQKMVCRPGHATKIYNAFFSPKDQFFVSIGQDMNIIIYQLSQQKVPLQVYKTRFTNQALPLGISGCFTQIQGGYRVFVPGTSNLQIVQQLISRWQIKKTNFSHSQPILVAQDITQHILVTCCTKNICLWSITKQQKLIQFQDVSMSKILTIPNSFIGSMNNGNIYFYNHQLPKIQSNKQQKQNEINQQQQESQSKKYDQNMDLQYQQPQQDQQQHQIQQQKQQQQIIIKSKKRIADKIIKIYPQQQIRSSTQFFDQYRFLYVNRYGFVIQSREMDEKSIGVQFYTGDNNSGHLKNLFRNKQFMYFGIKGNIVCYANKYQYGVRIDNFSSWEKEWVDIQAIAISGEWIAVAGLSQIRFVDIAGNLIKEVCFDRPIIAMDAYQNLLAVVYHQNIPMYECQVLAMRIFTVNHYQVSSLPDCHVPLSVPDINNAKGSILKWFGFSAQGMIFSQDSFGIVRAYSLQSNEWTPVIVQNLTDSKKAWILGFQKNQVKYWKTTESEPEPTVRPRFPIKKSNLMLATLQQNLDDLQNLPHMLWKRYYLDHEMARWRLWGRYKFTRMQKHINYQQSKTILTQKLIHQQHINLDLNFYKIIKYYSKNQQITKAVSCVKSHIRTIQAGKNLVDYFDDVGCRSQAIDLQLFYDEKQKETQYESMQQLALIQLKSKIQTTIKNKKQNPMNPKFKKQMNSTIPYNISSQPSQNSSIVIQDITHKSQQGIKEDQQIQNPFLKKKPTSDRKQQIEEHIEKYAVKKKVQEKKKSNKW